MTTFKVQTRIQASKGKVWPVLANIGQVYRYAPGVEKSYYIGNQKEGIGAARICELSPAGKVKEKVMLWDDQNGYTLKIEGLEKMPTVKDLTAKLELNAITSHMSEVSVVMEYQMKLGILGKLLDQVLIKSKLKKAMEGTLEGLKVYIEQGVEITNKQTLEQYLNVA